MAKKTEVETPAAEQKTTKKRPNYKRKMPIQYGPSAAKGSLPCSCTSSRKASPSPTWQTVLAYPVRA